MRLSSTIELYGGGAGSGCNPEAGVCGRKPSGKDFTKIGGQKGSNPGGTYQDKAGSKYYVKFYGHQERTNAEVLANMVYKAVGVPVPNTFNVTVEGKDGIASEMLPGTKSMSAAQMKASDDVKSGFVADAYLANHDVVGLVHDNIVHSSDGHDYRIDNGGAMFYRAQGSFKSFYQKNKDDVPEIDSMRNPNIAREAGDIFKGISNAEIKTQAGRLVQALSDSKLASMVKSAGFEGKQAKQYMEHLTGRRDAIARRFGL